MNKTVVYIIAFLSTLAAVIYLNVFRPLDNSSNTAAASIKKDTETSQASSKQASVETSNSANTSPDSVDSQLQTAPQAALAIDHQLSESAPKVATEALNPTTTDASVSATTTNPTSAQTDKIETNNTVRVLLIPERETTVSSTIAARIIRFNGNLGQRFRRGDILVSYDCEEALARVNMAKAELAGAIDQHEAKVKMQGLEQASDIEVSLAASAANKAKAQLDLSKAQVAQCNYYAPWDGRVAKANVKNNMTVTPGQPLMDIVMAGPLKLKLNAPSKLLGQLNVGSKFEISIDETGKSYSAAITALNSRVDPVSQTVEAEARMTQAYAELLPGMSGIADFSHLNF